MPGQAGRRCSDRAPAPALRRGNAARQRRAGEARRRPRDVAVTAGLPSRSPPTQEPKRSSEGGALAR